MKKKIDPRRSLTGEATRVSHPAADRPQGPKDASLVQIYGPQLGQRYVIDREELTIGRDSSNDIHLDTDNVSRAHARVMLRPNGVVFEDLGSTNGSLVNDGETQRMVLQNGDIIKIGSVMLKYISSGNAEALYHEEIYRMTIQDGLTGVANKRYFMDFIERELARAHRYERPLSLAMFDIDHFKKINDEFGHLAGDYVLRLMATEIRGSIRREELFARYGGEEFAIVMPETGIDKAELFAEKVRAVVESTAFEFDDERIPVTISLGVAQLSSKQKDPASFIKVADEALYRAKKGGRNQVQAAE